jgi:hypothetical protein
VFVSRGSPPDRVHRLTNASRGCTARSSHPYVQPVAGFDILLLVMGRLTFDKKGKEYYLKSDMLRTCPFGNCLSYLVGRTKADFRQIGPKRKNSRKVCEKLKMTLV